MKMARAYLYGGCLPNCAAYSPSSSRWNSGLRSLSSHNERSAGDDHETVIDSSVFEDENAISVNEYHGFGQESVKFEHEFQTFKQESVRFGQKYQTYGHKSQTFEQESVIFWQESVKFEQEYLESEDDNNVFMLRYATSAPDSCRFVPVSPIIALPTDNFNQIVIH